MNCYNCGAELIWGGDAMYGDIFGMSGDKEENERIVTNLSCPNCGAEVESISGRTDFEPTIRCEPPVHEETSAMEDTMNNLGKALDCYQNRIKESVNELLWFITKACLSPSNDGSLCINDIFPLLDKIDLCVNRSIQAYNMTYEDLIELNKDTSSDAGDDVPTS